MKPVIVPENERDLFNLIQKEIRLNGNQCDLNHIDVSNIIDMSGLFKDSEFNGDINKWNTSNVKNMEYMFFSSKFNGDISNWNVSKVEDMEAVFYHSEFNGDISKWDVSRVKDMKNMFCYSKLLKDLTIWMPYSLIYTCKIFFNSKFPIPYWAKFDDQIARNNAIDNYWLSKELKEELKSSQPTNTPSNKKSKI